MAKISFKVELDILGDYDEESIKRQMGAAISRQGFPDLNVNHYCAFSTLLSDSNNVVIGHVNFVFNSKL